MLLAGATLSPGESEMRALALGYRDVRAAVDTLYAVPEARCADPALRFVADARIIDWMR